MDDLVLLSLPSKELRVFLALRHSCDKFGETLVSMDELGELTGYGRTALSQAVAGLVERKLLLVHRMKRDFGRLARNKYIVVPCSPERTRRMVEGESPRSRERTSTRVLNKSLSNVSNVVITTEVTAPSAPSREEKKMRWQDDDENLGGFGLLDGEVPSAQKATPVSKRLPKTRHLRPQDEWTAADVATEFSFRVYARLPKIPKLLNTNNLRQRLSVNRSRYDMTALIELEAMDAFLADERNMTRILNAPEKAHEMFLASIAKQAPEILEQYGESVQVAVDNPPRVDYIVASDGKQFDNSMPGRAALKRYEEKLKGN